MGPFLLQIARNNLLGRQGQNWINSAARVQYNRGFGRSYLTRGCPFGRVEFFHSDHACR